VIWTVIKKELRGYFNSAIAVIFLAAFLAVAFYTFFWREKFFARGLADLRPLFEWMPRLLIILVSALAMRIWSDERRAGTLEILLTLPVPRWQLVLGKFAAGLALIAVALALTLGLPITIAMMGHLDWGPVIGGYLAALLLSAAYLSVGMCVSVATDNQIVSFVATAFACCVMYALGDIPGAFGRLVGTGARFESIARGVLDLRDLAYYAGIVAVGLALNVLILQLLGTGRSARARSRRLGAILGVGLILANAVALDLWLAPVARARIDLTQDGTFSLSSASKHILDGLDEPLLIRGYFSEQTHPKLAPLVPQIRDLLEEYRLAGHGKVRIELVDPESDEAKREAKERFGIEPVPMRFASKNEKSVVNAYFAIAIEYGDQHAVLGLDDLISVRMVDVGDIEIGLRNLEYQLTKTIKKTVSEFSSVDALFASMPGKVQLTAYITPKTLPDAWKDVPQKLQKVVDALSKQAGGKLDFTKVEPQGDAQIQDLFERFGLRPYQDLPGGDIYYFTLLVQAGNRIVRVAPPQNASEGELKTAILEGLKRAAPGFTRVVGLWVPSAPPPIQMEGIPPQQMPPPQTFEQLRRSLSGNYEVRDIQLDAPIPDDVEALVLAGPANLSEQDATNVDQFVMRGGALVALAGHFRVAPTEGLSLDKVTTGLETLFGKWGITIGDQLVMDPKNDAFPVPVEKPVGNGMVVREIQQIPYPYFVKIEGDQLSSSSEITAGLAGSVLHFVAPVKAETKVGGDTHKVEVLERSSDKSWLTDSLKVEPDLDTYPELGFPPAKPTDHTASQPLAVAIVGGFASNYAKPDAKDHRLAHSPPDARVVVFGSSAFCSDDVLALAAQGDADLATGNVELVHNAVDWALADTELLAIRSRDAASRALTVDPDVRPIWRDVNLAIAAAALALVVLAAWLRRRAVRPVTREAA